MSTLHWKVTNELAKSLFKLSRDGDHTSDTRVRQIIIMLSKNLRNINDEVVEIVPKGTNTITTALSRLHLIGG
jgi:hypothetical protein